MGKISSQGYSIVHTHRCINGIFYPILVKSITGNVITPEPGMLTLHRHIHVFMRLVSFFIHLELLFMRRPLRQSYRYLFRLFQSEMQRSYRRYTWWCDLVSWVFVNDIVGDKAGPAISFGMARGNYGRRHLGSIYLERIQNGTKKARINYWLLCFYSICWR